MNGALIKDQTAGIRRGTYDKLHRTSSSGMHKHVLTFMPIPMHGTVGLLRQPRAYATQMTSRTRTSDVHSQNPIGIYRSFAYTSPGAAPTRLAETSQRRQPPGARTRRGEATACRGSLHGEREDQAVIAMAIMAVGAKSMKIGRSRTSNAYFQASPGMDVVLEEGRRMVIESANQQWAYERQTTVLTSELKVDILHLVSTLYVSVATIPRAQGGRDVAVDTVRARLSPSRWFWLGGVGRKSEGALSAAKVQLMIGDLNSQVRLDLWKMALETWIVNYASSSSLAVSASAKNQHAIQHGAESIAACGSSLPLTCSARRVQEWIEAICLR
ncbi:hypothetical protein BJ912DRAFT_923294 [Pholiota molesta]|nr:hypothetical protein BJ912DRAFT_923294 [Pholiota molesta]